MKAKWIIVLGCILALCSGCKVLSLFTQFDLAYNSTVVVPSSINRTLPFDIPTPEIQTNSESHFSVNQTQSNLIEEISLKELGLNLKSPESGDFSFLNEIRVFIVTKGLPDKEIAWLTNIPDTIGKELQLNVTQENVMDYIKQESFSLRVRVTTDKLITVDHEIDIRAVLHVDAKIFGL